MFPRGMRISLEWSYYYGILTKNMGIWLLPSYENLRTCNKLNLTEEISEQESIQGGAEKAAVFDTAVSTLEVLHWDNKKDSLRSRPHPLEAPSWGDPNSFKGGKTKLRRFPVFESKCPGKCFLEVHTHKLTQLWNKGTWLHLKLPNMSSLYWIWRREIWNTGGVVERSSGLVQCGRIRVPVREALRGHWMKLWRWSLNCNRDPTVLEMPGLWDVHQA